MRGTLLLLALTSCGGELSTAAVDSGGALPHPRDAPRSEHVGVDERAQDGAGALLAQRNPLRLATDSEPRAQRPEPAWQPWQARMFLWAMVSSVEPRPTRFRHRELAVPRE